MTPTKQTLLALLEYAYQTHVEPEVIQRLLWFAHFAEHKSVSKTCIEFSIARSTFYRWHRRFRPEDLSTLQNIPKSTLLGERRALPSTVQQPVHNCPFCTLWQYLCAWGKRFSHKPAMYLALAAAIINISFFLLIALPQVAGAASSWSPTLLVNTESFQVIDDGNSTDIELRFGTSGKELRWNVTDIQFEFDGSLEVVGAISGATIHGQDLLTSSGQLIVEANTKLNPASILLDQNSNGSGMLIDSESLSQAALLIDVGADGRDASGDATNTHLLFGYNNVFDTNLFRQKADTLYTDDDLWIGETASGARLHAEDSLTSSGTLVTEGSITTQDDYIFFSGTSFEGTLDHAITAARTWTMPDATTTLVGQDTTDTLTNKTIDVNSNAIANMTGALIWYVDSDLTVATEQSVTFTLPFAFTVTDIELHVKTAPVGSSMIIDINEDGTTIFSTNAEVDASATVEDGNHIFSDTSLAKGSEITIDIDQIGSGTAGNGLTIQLMGTYDM